jgi:hypothetical protein
MTKARRNLDQDFREGDDALALRCASLSRRRPGTWGQPRAHPGALDVTARYRLSVRELIGKQGNRHRQGFGFR